MLFAGTHPSGPSCRIKRPAADVTPKPTHQLRTTRTTALHNLPTTRRCINGTHPANQRNRGTVRRTMRATHEQAQGRLVHEGEPVGAEVWFLAADGGVVA